MKFAEAGNTGFRVSTVCFGTWTIGGADWGRTDDRDSVKAIHRAMDLEINIFDTAPLYGNGHAETVLGEALDGVRHDVFIATKCGPFEDKRGFLRLDLSKEGIFSQCEQSLRRLKTDYIDLMQVHWNDTGWPVEETMLALAALRDKGMIRAYGVSNFSPAEFETAINGGCQTIQSPYNLMNTGVESDILPMCKKYGTGFLAYETLGRGLLAGRYTPTTRFQPGDIRLTDPRFRGEQFTDALAKIERLKRIADMFGLTPVQAAIVWVNSNPDVTSAICGIRTATQAVADAAAADVEPDPEMLSKLRKVFTAAGWT